MNSRVFNRSANTAAPELRTDLGLSISIDTPVLITGDPSDARRVALAIHQRSGRSKGPFIAVSCALPVPPVDPKSDINLLALGRLALGGTLFVEHVNRTCASLQRDLMRVLEGISDSAPETRQTGASSVRLLVASSSDLYSKVVAREFREDLFYRLNVVHLRLPVEDELTAPVAVRELTAAREHFGPLIAAGSLRGHDRSFAPPAIEGDIDGDFCSEASLASGLMDDAGRPNDELLDFPEEDSPPAKLKVKAPSGVNLGISLAAAGREFARLRQHVSTASRQFRKDAVNRSHAFARNVVPIARTMPFLQFVGGMLVGGSLVFIGTTAGAQLASLSLQRAQSPGSTLVPPSQNQPIAPTEPVEDTIRGSRSDGVYRSSLQVDSIPSGARVYLNNENVGTTPLNLSGLPVGSRALRLELPGYERWSSAITVTTERRTRVLADLDPVRAPSTALRQDDADPLRAAEQASAVDK